MVGHCRLMRIEHDRLADWSWRKNWTCPIGKTGKWPRRDLEDRPRASRPAVRESLERARAKADAADSFARRKRAVPSVPFLSRCQLRQALFGEHPLRKRGLGGVSRDRGSR